MPPLKRSAINVRLLRLAQVDELQICSGIERQHATLERGHATLPNLENPISENAHSIAIPITNS
jgi:hypothetical protein